MVSLAMDKVRSDGIAEGADTQNEDAQALAAWLAAQRTQIVAAWVVLARQRSPALAHCLPAEAVRASIQGGLAEIETALGPERAPRFLPFPTRLSGNPQPHMLATGRGGRRHRRSLALD